MCMHFRCLPSDLDSQDWADLMELWTVHVVAIQQKEYTPLI